MKVAAALALFLAGAAFGLHLSPTAKYIPPPPKMPAAVHERPLDLLRLTTPICPPR